MKKKKKLIIFDMDGTLIDSGSVITNTINYVREKQGLEILSKDSMLKALNDPNINSSHFFYGTYSFTQEQTKLFQEYYDEHCTSDIVLYSGIEKLLNDLSGNYLLSVATNANSIYANRMLEFLAIKNYFSLIAGADMVKHPKPKSDILEFSCNELKINKENTILVGDSKKDWNAAKDFKIKCILVNWGFSQYESDNETIVVNDVEDLIRKIKTLI